MASSKDLFILVKSLTKAEKAFFLKFCNLQQGEKNYLKVYREMLKMEEYNEEKIIKKYKGEKFVKSIHVTRNYLYKQILKSLRSGRVNDLIDTKISNLLVDASTLELKGLYEQSFALLKKARALAQDYHKLPYLLQVIQRQINHVINIKTKNLSETVDHYYEEAVRAGEHYAQEWHYYELNHRLFSLYRKHGRKKQSAEVETILYDMMSERTLHVFPAEGTFYSRYLFHNIHAISHLIKTEFSEARKHYEAIISIWESHPKIVEEKPHLYKIHVSNYLNCLHWNSDYEPFMKAIEKLENLRSRSFDEEAETFQNVVLLKLLYYLNTQQFEKGKELAEPIEAGLKKYASKVNKAREITLWYNMTVLYFASEDYGEALGALGRILHDERSEIRQDMQRFSRILELIFHYELGNTEVLEFFYRSTIRKLKRKGGMDEYEETVLNYLKSIFFAVNKREAIDHLEDLRDALEKFKQSQKKLLGYGELMIWIGNKLGETDKGQPV
ncbi:MAG: hypothetical protein AAF502_19585 [Bacteroidota bacterium]